MLVNVLIILMMITMALMFVTRENYAECFPGNTAGLKLKKGDTVYVIGVHSFSKTYNPVDNYYATFTGYRVAP